jgi:hypothetical protein
VVAASPLFRVPDPQSDVLSTLQQLPETIKREDFIELYFENLRLRENQAKNPLKTRQTSTPKVSHGSLGNKENEGSRASNSPNCYVNYVTNNFNLNFMSPFKSHLKNTHKEATLRPPQDKTGLKLIDFSRFFVKKKGAPVNSADLKIKKRNMGPLGTVSHPPNPPSDSEFLSTQMTPEPSPSRPFDHSNTFTFDGLPPDTPLLTRGTTNLTEPNRLDFTFSYRPI